MGRRVSTTEFKHEAVKLVVMLSLVARNKLEPTPSVWRPKADASGASCKSHSVACLGKGARHSSTNPTTRGRCLLEKRKPPAPAILPDAYRAAYAYA